nr:alcohol-forming fatty acyl-CoA reductase [Tanacetum cinerariifolium]
MKDPMRFLNIFSSTKARTVVFNTLLTTYSLITASQTIDSHCLMQFTAVGYLDYSLDINGREHQLEALQNAGQERMTPHATNTVKLATHVERRLTMGKRGYERVKE